MEFATKLRDPTEWGDIGAVIALGMITKKGIIIYGKCSDEPDDTLNIKFPCGDFEHTFAGFNCIKLIHWGQHYDFVGYEEGTNHDDEQILEVWNVMLHAFDSFSACV